MIQAGRALAYRPLNRLHMDISSSYVFISGARSATADDDKMSVGVGGGGKVYIFLLGKICEKLVILVV